MSFKPGDRVRCIDVADRVLANGRESSVSHFLQLNEIYTIEQVVDYGFGEALKLVGIQGKSPKIDRFSADLSPQPLCTDEEYLDVLAAQDIYSSLQDNSTS